MANDTTVVLVAANDNYHDFYVYAWLRPDGTPFYVGKGRASRDKTLKIHNPIFMRIVDKMRREGGEPRVVRWHEGLLEADAICLEVAYIKLFGRRNLGTGVLCNLTDGGDGASGYKHTKETLARMSQSSSGKTHSMETRERLRDLALNMSDEQRKKIGDARRGKSLSEEHRAKIGQASRGNKHRLGKPQANEVRAKISAALRGEKNHNYGKIFSMETCAKISDARRMRGPRNGAFKGIRQSGSGWRSQITANGETRNLGTFPTPEEAARAYDAAAVDAWGINGFRPNFPQEAA